MRLLILLFGPSHDPDREFGRRLAGMSDFCHGDLVVRATVEATGSFGDFTVRTIQVNDRNSLVVRIEYLLTCLRVLLSARFSGSKVDAVLTYDPLFTGLVGLILSRLFRTKLIVEVNGDYSADANYRHIKEAKARDKRRRYYMKLARMVLSRASAIKTMFPDHLKRLGLEPTASQEVRLFSDFVNTENFSPGEDRPEVLVLGYPWYVKGMDTAIRSFKQVSDDFPEWTLKLMGYFPDKEALLEEVAGHPRIIIHKPVLHKDVVAHIQSCGIFLLPSRTEGMPRVLIEAMACCKPLIASNINGIPYLVREGENGLLCDPEDVAGFADGMRRLMSDESLRVSMGERGRKIALREYSPEKYFTVYEEFLHSIQ